MNNPKSKNDGKVKEPKPWQIPEKVFLIRLLIHADKYWNLW